MSQIAAISSLSGLVGYWPCEETSGTSAADKASSPANAALSGTGGVLRAWNSPGGVGAAGLRPYSSSALTVSATSKLDVGDTFTAGVFFRRRAAVTGALMQRGDIYGALGAELLTDSGMESSLITSGYNGWRDSIGTGSGAFTDTAEHHGGSQSIRIDVNSSGSNAGINQGLDSAAPGRYTVSFWYKNDAHASGRMSLQVMYTPVAGGSVQYLQTGTTNVWSTSSNDALYGIANATTWTQVTLTFDLPETTGTGASGLRIILKRAAGYGGGVAYSFWVDDASLKLQTTTVGTHALVLTSGGVVQLLAGSGGAATIVASSDPAHPITDHLGWHSVVLTKNGSATAIYIDGIDRTVAGTNVTLSATGTDLTWFSGSYGVQPVVGAHMFLANRAITATEQSTIYAAANMLPDRATSPQIRVGMCQFTAEMNLANAAVEAAALRSLHVTSTREAFDWLVAESTQGTYDWSAFDTMVDAQVAQGLSIQAMFMPRTPFWARTPTSDTHSRYVPGAATKGISVADANNDSLNGGKGTNAYTTWRDRWITYIVAAVHRYKDRVHIWELGNECNMSIFWGPAASAPLFVDWYNAARTAILAELGADAPNHRIVMGGLARLRSEAGTTDAQSYTADEWLRAMLDLGVANFDAIGYHPYIANNNSPWSHNLNSASLDNAHQVRDTLMEYNRTSVLVELNEFGWYTHNTTVAASSDGLTLPQSTITVADGTKVNTADPVASAGDLGGGTASGFYIETTNGWELFGHTGLVGNTLTGCTGGTGTIHTGSRISFGTNPLSETQQAQYVADSLAIVRDQFSAFCDTWTYFTAFETNISGGDAFAFCAAWYGTDFTKPKLMTKALAVAAQPYDTIDAGTTLSCAIYNPTPVTTTIIDPYNDPAGLTYVSNSSMAYWRGKYWAIMDGTTEGFVEGSTGQQIWLTTSTDGVTWTTAIQPFRDATYCNNPKTGTTLEWQPNLVVVNNQLWCSWSAADAFISILNDPTEKWTNYRLEYIDDNQVFTSSTLTSVTGGRSNRLTKDGQNDWIVFPSSNPIVLQDGRVAIPATAYSNTLQSTQTAATDTFVKARKYNMLLIVDAGGTITPTYLDTTAFGDFCAWEPFVVQNPAGHIYVFHRNLNMTSTDADFLLVSVSYDNGETFSSAVSTEMLVPSARGSARQVSPSRWVLTHCDEAQGSTGSAAQAIDTDRSGGALFLSRRGGNDFAPGVTFLSGGESVNAPQVVAVGENIYVHYTSGNGVVVRRSLKLTQFPSMSEDVCYVFPRQNNDPAYCGIVSGTTLRIHGEGSAAVELPHGATQVTLRFRLGALPVGTDRYTVATFGDASSPARLYIDAASPTTLSCNGVAVTTLASPLAWNTIQVVVTAQKVTIGSVEQYFSGKPRLFLGSAYPEGLLATTKTLDHDVSAMQMSRSHTIPRPVPVIADIACWGDSLTYSQTTGDVQASPTWPQTLATTLGVAVYNGGQGAHGSAEVATRQGGLQPLVTLTGNQIPSGTTAAISLTAISPTTGWRTGNVASAGLNMHGSLAGVNGTLRHDLTNALANVFTFTPDAAPASTVSVPALTPFVGDEGTSMRNRVNIIWVGTNNTSQPTAIVRDITSMIANLPAGTTRYLVVSNTQNSMTTLNTALQAAFGDNYADLRSYLISDGLADAGITPVSQDATDIANGNVPSSLKYDGTHFVQAAYNIIGAWFAQEITARGWV